MKANYDFGLIGLGVMGRNFILNVADKGFSTFGHDNDSVKVNALLAEGYTKDEIDASTKVDDLINALSKPRKIMLLVPAGKLVDTVIDTLLPHLSKGDLIIDGGNSFYEDTNRREAFLVQSGIHFIGAGVSGGAKGARLGPSIMPGGDNQAYQHIKPIFEAVAAQYQGEACVAHLGPKSAGNYVKMVHNGIEYALMQLTAEIYDLLKKSGGYNNDELSRIFKKWNDGRLQSFLVEITAAIFDKKDELGKGHLVDIILDKAKQKGTGKWTSQNAMDLGIPIPSIDIAVSMREISALKEERLKVAALYEKPKQQLLDKDELEKLTEEAMYFAFIITYAQGFHQLRMASKEYEYHLNLAQVAKVWRAGCIIRASLLVDISKAYETNNQLENIMQSEEFVHTLQSTTSSVRKLVSHAATSGIALPALSNCLTYFDAYTSARLPLNLIQAQRDYFGSHGYERLDQEGFFHTEWD